MKLLAAAIPALAVGAFFVGIRAETPWLGPKTDDVFSVAASHILMNSGQSLVIATVPNSKRLVVTAATIDDFVGGGQWVEIDEVDATGATVVKVPAGLAWTYVSGYAIGSAGAIGHGDGLGAVFGAGSNVVLKNVDPVGTNTAAISYFVGGYLAPK